MRRLILLALLLAGCPVNAPVIREMPVAGLPAGAHGAQAGVAPVSYPPSSVRVEIDDAAHRVWVGDDCCVLIDERVAAGVAETVRAEGIEPVWRDGRLVLSLDHDRSALHRAAAKNRVVLEALRLLRDLQLGD